jgi:ribonuclease HII
MLEFEEKYWYKGMLHVAGLDEAGRGPLAGSVVAAAVVFDKDFMLAEKDNNIISLINDSKLLKEKTREEIFEYMICTDGIQYAVGEASVEEIDKINILQATWLAMGRAIENLKSKPDIILVDGLPVKGLSVASESIIKGDLKSISIAAASIIAKVTRDRKFKNIHEKYPEYGFASHKGYGSKKHIEAINKYGPCPIHRKTFKPVADAIHKAHGTGEFLQINFDL